MTPPISIDGTDITGATIDGTDVQEITVDGQTVFSASVGEPNSDLFFPLNEGTGTTVTETKQGLNATITGATWVSGEGFGNNYLSFDGNDFVETNNNLTTINGAHTQAYWVFPDSGGNFPGIGNVGQGSETQLAILLDYSPGDIYAWGLGASYRSNLTFDVNVWNMIMVTYNGAQTVSVYHGSENTSFQSDSGNNGGVLNISDDPIYLGSRPGGSQGLIGDIGQAAFWNRELSATEAQSHFDDYKSLYNI